MAIISSLERRSAYRRLSAICGRVLGTAALIACFLSGPPAALAETLHTTRLGNWIAVSDSGHGAGKGLECSVTARYRNGRSYSIVADSSLRWSLRVGSARWRLPPETTERVIYWVDNEKPFRTTAVAEDRHTLIIRVADGAWLFERFRNARMLHFRIGEQKQHFAITHASRALNWMLGCVDKAAQAALERSGPALSRKTAPFARRFALTKDLSDSPWHPFIFRDTREIDWSVGSRIDNVKKESNEQTIGSPGGGRSIAFLSIVLDSAGLYGNRVDILDADGRWAIPVDALWRTDDFHGAIRRLDTMNNDYLRMINQQVSQRDEDRCPGEFSSSDITSAVGGPKGFLTICENAMLSVKRYYAAVPAAGDGGYLMMLRAVSADDKTAKDMIAQIVRASLTVATSSAGAENG